MNTNRHAPLPLKPPLPTRVIPAGRSPPSPSSCSKARRPSLLPPGERPFLLHVPRLFTLSLCEYTLVAGEPQGATFPGFRRSAANLRLETVPLASVRCRRAQLLGAKGRGGIQGCPRDTSIPACSAECGPPPSASTFAKVKHAAHWGTEPVQARVHP
jgi:hypothetical protein